jgi:hypothetical protein
MGRLELPDLFQRIWDRLPGDQLIKALGDTWVMCDFPERHMSRRGWLKIFHVAGYHEDDTAAEPPEKVTLWRGGTRRTGMAWTADREQAEFFQHRYEESGTPGKLWTITVGPRRLLAHYHEKHRNEDEYVIDSTGIKPKEVTHPSHVGPRKG